jgi:arabinose-5-phosphate isomerase
MATPTEGLDRTRALERAREVIRIESRSIEALEDRLGDEFLEAVELILDAPGRIVVTGIGKSGVVARKIASTLASTGTPALFLHPAEGMHGDVGVLVRGDVLLAVSKSGESRELADLLPSVRRLEIPVIALTGTPTSELGRAATVVLDVSVDVEACPHDLAPTSSTTAALALGDALAMVLLDTRDFGPRDFARLHPGGTLGRRLLWEVEDVMLQAGEDEVPSVAPDDTLADAMHEIAFRRGTVPVLDDGGAGVGVITAGDLTRYAGDHPDFLGRPVREAMNPSPLVAEPDALAVDALDRMREHGIMALPVVDGDGRLTGIVHLHDLLEAGVG